MGIIFSVLLSRAIICRGRSIRIIMMSLFAEKEEELRDIVLLVLANKQDLPNATNCGEITDKLKLHTQQNRRWYVQSTCAVQGTGLYERLDWLTQELAKKLKNAENFCMK